MQGTQQWVLAGGRGPTRPNASALGLTAPLSRDWGPWCPYPEAWAWRTAPRVGLLASSGESVPQPQPLPCGSPMASVSAVGWRSAQRLTSQHSFGRKPSPAHVVPIFVWKTVLVPIKRTGLPSPVPSWPGPQWVPGCAKDWEAGASSSKNTGPRLEPRARSPVWGWQGAGPVPNQVRHFLLVSRQLPIHCE